MDLTGLSVNQVPSPTSQTHSRAPRILEVLYSFRVGGSEVVGLELAHQLARSGAEVLCTALDGMTGPLRDRCAELGLEVVDLGLPKTNILGRNGISLPLLRRLRELSLDAIHLQHFVALNKLGLAARLASIPRVVVTEHSEAQLLESIAGRIRLRLNWRLAHSITVIHAGLKRYLVDALGIAASRVVVIPNGIDLVQWQASDRAERRMALGFGSEFVFVYVGRIEPVKRVPELISAFLRAQEQLSQPARLVVVGGGSELAKCWDVLAGNPFAHTVMLMGEQHDTRRFFSAADAFVLNSLSEGVPRALLEAMSMGLPGICTAVGGIPEILEGRGWLTIVHSPDSVVLALLEAARNPIGARALGMQAKSFVSANYDAQALLYRYRSQLLRGINDIPAQATSPSNI